MIPKVIHYCWFGRNPLPSMALKCIESWRRYLPGYEVKEWNEDNFDVDVIPYTKAAYAEKRYAFVSDYARFWILYNYGGVYFDTDVELVRPMEYIIAKGPFMGCEYDYNSKPGIRVNPGLGLSANRDMLICKEMIDLYASLSFYREDGAINFTTIVHYTTELLLKHGLRNVAGIQEFAGIVVYPTEYFCPKSYRTNKINLTENSYSIHHFSDSWHSPFEKFKKHIRNILGDRLFFALLKKRKSNKK